MRRPPAPDVRAGLLVIAALAVAGVVLGFVWKWWSPPGPVGFVIAPNAVQPDETEAFIAADGRYAIIVVVAGLLAGVAVWFVRSARGPLAAVALGLGGLAGAALTEFVGHQLAGGHSDGPANTVIDHLPLSVHISGLRLLEAAVAVLVYGLLVSFAPADDLGRPEQASVGAGGEPQDGWRHGDAPGALHEPKLTPQ